MKIQKITFAGHSAFFFDCDGKTFAIDPWLEGNPKCPADLKTPEQLDLILLTHGHADHASDVLRLAKHHGSKIAATYELAMLLIQEGVPQEHVMPMNKGGTVQWEGLHITLTNAFHSSSYDTANGPVYAGEPAGFVVRDGSTSIYHAGDTCLFNDMKLIGEMYRPKVAMLPIGDVFTMGPAEAAQAAQFLGVKVCIPMHYATFDALTGTAEEFGAECAKRDIESIALEPGANYVVP